jgi:hypothetical protein
VECESEYNVQTAPSTQTAYNSIAWVSADTSKLLPRKGYISSVVKAPYPSSATGPSLVQLA